MKPVFALALRLLGLLFGAACLTVVAGGLLQRPWLVGVVPSGSMAPALNSGDMVVIMPVWAAPSPDAGAIIVFRSTEVPWVVHRIVGGDPDTGWVTRGDANPEPDRERVFAGDMAGVVPQVAGRPVRLANVGHLAMRLRPMRSQGAILLLLAGGAGLVGWEAWRGRRRRSRRQRRPLLFWVSMALGVGLALLVQGQATTAVSGGQVELVSAVGDRALQPGQVLIGTERVEVRDLTNTMPVPVAAVLTSSSPLVRLEPGRFYVPPFGTASYNVVTVGVGMPGRHEVFVRRSFFLPLLPLPLLAALAERHPALPGAVTALIPVCLILLLGLADPAACKALRLAWLRVRLRLDG